MRDIVYLHENPADFKELVRQVAEYEQMPQSFIVKDYFAVQILKEVTRRNPALVFKGGTCLSKCYGVINRFSEDIDLGIQAEHATEGMRKRIKQAVVESAYSLGLSIENLDRTRSRREFNRYEMPLPNIDKTTFADKLVVETAVMTPADPAAYRSLQSFIGIFCEEQRFVEAAEEYDLGPFEVLANSLERTFCDKTFALCDYYLAGSIPPRQSRHMYDLCKLLDRVPLDETLLELLKIVRRQRLGGSRTPSANPAVDISDTLQRIASYGVYQEDYEKATAPLLYDDLSYEDAATAVMRIAAFLKGKL
ncbi:nucleotidyl transferase AbiEii/AbiGii toxin family protein [Adlercreutzia sp. ZJ141]|uniref:nucleotidyl transferase AbiEii/AbiGii toxin family protein n=1 Tax=Adlercreutzia sp. ZJ141 TaxID=2709406 RepID=UPI001F155E56|nr:nucleotidyl transferase AbiEii/AbiGii toxin family protein [Adlercreutzia sp. ZJ141]